MNNHIIFVRIATLNDIRYTLEIIRETEASAIARGTGIAKRSAQTVSQKMREGKAVIAVTSSGEWVGFAYLETWEQERFISNSGLIVSPDFRNTGVARADLQYNHGYSCNEDEQQTRLSAGCLFRDHTGQYLLGRL